MSVSMKDMMLRLFKLKRGELDHFALTLHPHPVIVTVLGHDEENVIISLPIGYIVAFQTKVEED